ncbi:hypothetical protein [Pseudomonas syringae]|uniref:hypothetical protein n=1 Tax=Pseudomonas syringae TaxID=317 RepID=UPI0015E19129|nr:hypothetical protein [Pseudomonas syringae]
MVELGHPRAGRRRKATADLHQYLLPLGGEHVNLTGDYLWVQSRKLEDGKFKPL